jgi:hypothetical protein
LAAILLLWLGAAEAARAQDAAPRLSAAEMEAFLLDAELTDVRDAGAGVTGSRRATASDGRLTHDVHIQSVDISRSRFAAPGGRVELNFRDSYLYNVAAYRLAVLLDIDNVPMSVLRQVDRRPAAVTWWVDDVAMTEGERIERRTMGPDPARTSRQFYTRYVFDELIQNRDRNQGNMLWTADWKMWLIDHTRAFRQDVELTRPERLTRIDRELLDNLRGLTPEALEAVLGDVLSRGERSSVMRRRDLLLQHFDDRIARIGEGGVVMDPEPAP